MVELIAKSRIFAGVTFVEIKLVARRQEGDPVNVYTYSTVEKILVQDRVWDVFVL
mgnify:CR=1 FL=1